MKSTTTFLVAHKIISGIALVIILGGGYWGYTALTSTAGQPRYVLGTVQTGTIVASVSGSGQVSASNQIDIKPRVSGQIVWVGITPGVHVSAGQGLVQIDSTDAKAALLNAEQSLQSSQLQYQKDQATAPIDYQNQQNALATAKDDLSTEYNNTFDALSTSYLDLPNVVTGSENVLYGYDLDTTGAKWNVDVVSNMFTADADIAKMIALATAAKTDYATARAKYDPSLLAYKATTREAAPSDIERLLAQSIDTDTAIAQALQSELNFLGGATDLAQSYNRKLPTALTTLQTNARSYLSTVNTDLSSLLAEKRALTTAKQTVTTDQQNLTLAVVGNPDGSNPISLQISKNNLATQEQNIAQLKQTLAEYTVVAPFDGIIASVAAKTGDTTPASVATIITTQKIANLSLNEVDAAKVQLGDKATLTFDAIDGLTLTGKIAEMDAVGTVSQGVVSYNLQIAFDSNDTRIKPGMTVNAAIQTEVKQDVLMVPTSAVKTTNGTSYVQMFTPPLVDTGAATGMVSVTPPQMVQVVTGISDDSNIEIVSGLSNGDQIVTRTVTGAALSATGGAATRTTGAAVRTGGGGAGGLGRIGL